jgi:hypothetical protein
MLEAGQSGRYARYSMISIRENVGLIVGTDATMLVHDPFRDIFPTLAALARTWGHLEREIELKRCLGCGQSLASYVYIQRLIFDNAEANASRQT